ncbi:MAG: hypothetical protein ABJ205_08710 [Erythrobacter sp.]|uniref:hypothetical protein n=1 Tax=Erythrobacter sp. TaxID=1042 RepID=UPI003266C429
MFRKTQLLLLSASAMSLAACSTPFGTATTDIKWDATPAAGTITVSDPKIYRREALINERRDERKWLDDLLEKSKTIEIKPEIIREIEVITAFSAGLGLKFDPAAGQTFTRNEETNDLRQQINVMRLQLELDQLRRDAELVRANFADQTAPANENLGQLGTSDLVANPGVTAEAAADAFTTLKSTIDSLTARLGATVNQPQLANASVNPIDEFRDRQAYRDILKTARNAASLDEQHDLDGNALLRLNFQATTLPGHEEPNVPGVVQVKLSQPEFSKAERQGVYAGWLSHINDRMNVFEGGAFKPNPALLAAATLGNYELVEYDYPKTEAAVDKCFGLRLPGGQQSDPEHCGTLLFATPAFSGRVLGEGAFSPLSDYLVPFNLQQDPEVSQRIFQRHRARIQNRETVTSLVKGCDADERLVLQDNLPEGDPNSEEEKLLNAIRTAQAKVAGGSVLIELDRKAKLVLRSNGLLLPANSSEVWPRVQQQYRQSSFLLASFEQRAFTRENCGNRQATAIASFKEDAPVFDVPGTFNSILNSPHESVSVYDVAPREQVQRISTFARSANSLGLALSIAASKPGSGIGGNLGANFVRQANGKAATIERAPAVVGYSLTQIDRKASSTSRTFGWVLGPQATVHPKGGRLELEQSLATYDLSADVSVPGWWPRIALDVITRWAPSTQSITNGRMPKLEETSPGQQSGTLENGRSFTVRRAINAADYDALTQRLTHFGQAFTRAVEIEDLSDEKLSYCSATTIHIKGNSLWRATAALFLGKQIGSDAITLAPDMGGIFVTLPAGKTLGHETGGKQTISIFTPTGSDSAQIRLQAKRECEKEKPKADPNAITITSVNPPSFTVSNSVPFRVEGTNLDKITSVKLGGAEELTIESREGKTVMNLRLKETQARGLSGEQSLIFYKDGKKGGPKEAVKTVQVQVNTPKK